MFPLRVCRGNNECVKEKSVSIIVRLLGHFMHIIFVQCASAHVTYHTRTLPVAIPTVAVPSSCVNFYATTAVNLWRFPAHSSLAAVSPAPSVRH